MNKVLLGALAVATAALLVWALMPTREAPVDAPSVAPAKATAPAAEPTADPDPAPATKARPKLAARAPAAPAVAGRDPTPRAIPRLEPPKLAPPLMPLPEGEVRPPDQARHGRDPSTDLARVDPVDFKKAVRQYYGNLPRTGRMPSRITVEEVFPPAVWQGLNVPPASQLVEIGHHPATSPAGLAEALEIPDDQMATFGVTVVTPDGQRVRDYIRVTTEAAEANP